MGFSFKGDLSVYLLENLQQLPKKFHKHLSSTYDTSDESDDDLAEEAEDLSDDEDHSDDDASASASTSDIKVEEEDGVTRKYIINVGEDEEDGSLAADDEDVIDIS